MPDENTPQRNDPPQQQERLQTLNEISRVVASALDLRTLYETIYEQIGRVMDASQFFIALWRQGEDRLDIPYLREDGRLEVDQQVPYGKNVTSMVIDGGKELLYHTSAEYERYEREHGLVERIVGTKRSESGIFVPLITERRTIGALTVQSMHDHAYTDADVEMLAVIAAQAAVAIENARLYARSQESVRETQALVHVAQSINSSLDLQTVLDAILTGMREVVPFYLASILLPDHAHRRLEMAGTIGPNAEGWRGTTIPFGQGVTGAVFESGEPVMVPDVRAYRGYISAPTDAVRSELAVPLKRGASVIGVLNVERAEVDGFSHTDMNLLSLFASQAAIAIENARLFRELQNRVSDLQIIQRIVQKLTPVHDIPGITAVINQELGTLIDYHSWRLFVVDADNEVLVPISIHGVPIGDRRLRRGQGITGWIAQHGQTVLIDNLLDDPRAEHIEGTPNRAESMIGAPLIYQGRVRGVITLTKLGSGQFDQNSLRLLEIIAAQMAIDFDRARLYDELRAEAITDPLTGLYNRRYLTERYVEERSRAIRNRHALAAMMVDIDKFKRVNDTYGHDAGDVVLQELASVIRTVVRAEDIVARYGGEEFTILLPETSPDHALHLGRRLRQTIEAYALPQVAGVKHVTVSVGVALLDLDDDGMELFGRADQAMYHVKRAGGNQVCLDDEGSFSMLG